MRKVYYIYNPQTQTYDRIYPTLRQRAMSYVRRLFIGMGLGVVCFIAPLIIFGSPSEKELRKENSRLEAQYRVLSRQMDEALGVLQDIQQRDDNLYRVIFMADPISPAIRQAGYGAARYEHLVDMADAELVVSTTQKMDLLTKQLYIQSRSFDDVVALCRQHDEMLRCIPAIQPVSNKDLKRTASGYGKDDVQGYFRLDASGDVCDLSLIGEKGCLKQGKAELATDGGFLPITRNTFDGDALVLENSQVHCVELCDRQRRPYVKVGFEAPVVGLWSPTRGGYAPFVCIEPWYGRCDREHFIGDFGEKDWMQHLQPGERFSVSYSITIL